jgi:hypothetical protein
MRMHRHATVPRLGRGTSVPEKSGVSVAARRPIYKDERKSAIGRALPGQSPLRLGEPPADTLARADRLWGRMTFEIGLMSQRMSWLVASQSLLVTALTFSLINQDRSPILGFLAYFVPVVGLFICAVMLIFVNAGLKHVAICREQLRLLKWRFPDRLRDDVDQSAPARWRRGIAVVGNYGMIAPFIVLWGTVFSMSNLPILLITLRRLAEEIEILSRIPF